MTLSGRSVLLALPWTLQQQRRQRVRSQYASLVAVLQTFFGMRCATRTHAVQVTASRFHISTMLKFLRMRDAHVILVSLMRSLMRSSQETVPAPAFLATSVLATCRPCLSALRHEQKGCQAVHVPCRSLTHCTCQAHNSAHGRVQNMSNLTVGTCRAGAHLVVIVPIEDEQRRHVSNLGLVLVEVSLQLSEHFSCDCQFTGKEKDAVIPRASSLAPRHRLSSTNAAPSTSAPGENDRLMGHI